MAPRRTRSSGERKASEKARDEPRPGRLARSAFESDQNRLPCSLRASAAARWTTLLSSPSRDDSGRDAAQRRDPSEGPAGRVAYDRVLVRTLRRRSASNNSGPGVSQIRSRSAMSCEAEPVRSAFGCGPSGPSQPLRPGARIEPREGDQGPLGLSERRLKLFVGVQVEPAAERLLRGQQGDRPLEDRRVIGRQAGEREGVQALARLHLGHRALRIELDRPVAVRLLEAEEPVDVRLDLVGEPVLAGTGRGRSSGRRGRGCSTARPVGSKLRDQVSGLGVPRLAGPPRDLVELPPGCRSRPCSG